MASTRLWQAARIVEDEAGQRWLEFSPLSDCARCRAGQGCGAAHWSRLFGDRQAGRLPLPADCTLATGRAVRAGVSARAVLVAATLAYLAPLLTFVLALVMLQGAVAEPLALLLAAGVALATLLGTRRGVRRQLSPRVEPAGPACAKLETGSDGGHV